MIYRVIAIIPAFHLPAQLGARFMLHAPCCIHANLDTVFGYWANAVANLQVEAIADLLPAAATANAAATAACCLLLLPSVLLLLLLLSYRCLTLLLALLLLLTLLQALVGLHLNAPLSFFRFVHLEEH